MLRRYFGEFARAAFLLVNRLLQRSERFSGRALILTIIHTILLHIVHHLISHLIIVELILPRPEEVVSMGAGPFFVD